MGTLTVRENLQFSAALRLPSHMTSSQRKERVEKVIAELGLQSCANTKVSTLFMYKHGSVHGCRQWSGPVAAEDISGWGGWCSQLVWP